MIDSLDTFYAASGPLVAAFERWSALAAPAAAADHLCYKCEDATEYERLRAAFERQSLFIYQSMIAGRRIAIIRLRVPITTSLGPLRVLELSDQKPDRSQKGGFDHVEIFPTSGTVEVLAAELEAKGVTIEKVVRPHHTTYDTTIDGGFKVRLEAEALIVKITREELR